MKNMTFALVALAVLLGAACSSGSDSSTPAGDAAAAPSAEATGRSIADVVADASDEATATSRGGNGGTGERTGAERPTQLKIDSPERQRLTAAIDSTQALSSYEFDWSMAIASLPGLPEGFSMGGTSAVDAANEGMAMTMDFTEMFEALMGAGGADASAEELAMVQAVLGEDPMEFRYVDGTTYFNWALLSQLIGAETPWVAFADESSDNAFESAAGLGGGQLMSPDSAVAFLNDVWGVEDIGRESVRGVETTHFRGVIDFVELMQGLDPEQITALEADLDGASLSDVFGDFPVDAWIDDDGVMRRFQLEMNFSGLGSAGAAAEATIGSMTVNYEFFNIGGNIVIEAPPASQVTEVSSSLVDAFSLTE